MADVPDPQELAKLYVEPTTACNLNCRMCVRQAWEEPAGQMSMAVYRALIEQVAALPHPPRIVFAGYGEPTCHPDILEMLRLAKATGARVEMVTNGSRLDARMAAALIDLGLDRVWFSIDGAQPASYEAIRRGAQLGALQDHIRGLYVARQRARAETPEIGLVFVAMRSNLADLPAVHWLAVLTHASELLVTNVLAHTPEMADAILYRRSVKAGRYVRSGEMPRVRLPRMDFDPDTGGPLLDLMGRAHSLELGGADLAHDTNRCPFVTAGAAAVRWDGTVTPCPPLLHSHPVYTPRRRTFVRHAGYGNVAETSLGEIWSSPSYAGFRDRVRAFHFSPCVSCGGCERSLGNEEDCYGNTFPVCGRCLWAQGIVRCP